MVYHVIRKGSLGLFLKRRVSLNKEKKKEIDEVRRKIDVCKKTSIQISYLGLVAISESKCEIPYL